jgi:uncharacterized membrane protein YtjA (UPF0391 family)
MLYIAVALVMIALTAALLGFSGGAGTAAGVAKLVFIIAMVLLAASVIFEGLRGTFRRPS